MIHTGCCSSWCRVFGVVGWVWFRLCATLYVFYFCLYFAGCWGGVWGCFGGWVFWFYCGGMASAQQWFQGARPHTWANAFAPVVAGSGAATASLYGVDVSGRQEVVGAWGSAASGWGDQLLRALLATVVAWALIVGVNFANDYSDGVRGTDDDRTGPLRLTASGAASPGAVKRATFAAFGVAGVAGVVLSLLSAWWLVVVGALCIVAAWFYTGGKNPYGYRGLGEVSVFVFFGLVAVLGTQFTQAGVVSWQGVLCAVSVGAMSAAVNLVNNLRDIPSDSEAGKITLAVRLGDVWTRRVWLVLVCVPVVASLVLMVSSVWCVAGLLAVPLLWAASGPVREGALGAALIPVLGSTGRAMLVWSVVTAVTLGLS